MRWTFAAMAWVLTAGGAVAQVDTPANCHWVSTPQDATTLQMWCRAEDGQARPVEGRFLRQATGNSSSGCTRNRIYDGARCVTEAQALAAAPVGPYYAPERSGVAPAAAPAKPRVLLFQDGKRGRSRGMACIDERDVTVCKPIRHR